MTANRSLPRTALLSSPMGYLPNWGDRRTFDGFFVELVPEAVRSFNFRVDTMYASIGFGVTEGSSGLHGSGFLSDQRQPFEYILVPPRFPLKAKPKQRPEVLAFGIDFDWIRGVLAAACGRPPRDIHPGVFRGSPLPSVTSLAKKIRTQIAGGTTNHQYLQALCVHMLVEMVLPSLLPVRRRSQVAFDEKAAQVLYEYIDANLDAALTVEDLANLLGMSPHQLNRNFKARTGDTPHNYVLQRRAEAARSLLIDDDLPLAEVAFATGFSSQSHMTSVLKKLFGLTPAALRQRDAR